MINDIFLIFLIYLKLLIVKYVRWYLKSIDGVCSGISISSGSINVNRSSLSFSLPSKKILLSLAQNGPVLDASAADNAAEATADGKEKNGNQSRDCKDAVHRKWNLINDEYQIVIFHCLLDCSIVFFTLLGCNHG